MSKAQLLGDRGRDPSTFLLTLSTVDRIFIDPGNDPRIVDRALVSSFEMFFVSLKIRLFQVFRSPIPPPRPHQTLPLAISRTIA